MKLHLLNTIRAEMEKSMNVYVGGERPAKNDLWARLEKK